MVECYGVFCSHHNESMSFYKEQLQNNKKMQLLMRVSEPHRRLWGLLEAPPKWFPFHQNDAVTESLGAMLIETFLSVAENRPAASRAQVGNTRVLHVGDSAHYEISHPGGADPTEH